MSTFYSRRMDPHPPVPAAPAGAAAEPVGYDPAKDPKRKPKRAKDPGWKYGYWDVIGNRDCVVCTLCGKKANGGIGRHKKHLAGGYGDVLECLKNTTEIKREMRAYLKANERSKPALSEDEDDDVVEVVGTAGEAESVHSVVKPSSGTAAKRHKRAAYQFKVTAPSRSAAVKSVAAMIRMKPDQIVDERRNSSAGSQPSIVSAMKTKEERHAVNLEWAFFFYECGIPLNVANSRQFQIAIEASCQYGSGYKPPTPHELREPLLNECVELTANDRAKHEAAWKQFGCTLMSDGWSDRRGRHLINFLVNSPEGTYFLESIDASSEAHDAVMIADLLEKRIEEVGKSNVVQVVTDNGANYKAAGKLLMERIPTLYWSPCAAHCLDLMLEDIGKLKAFKKPISQARRVTTFIYRHGRILSAMRAATGGNDLVRPGATRFATAFLTLKSLFQHKKALREMFTSSAWLDKKLATTQAGMNVHDIILSKDWWNSVEDCLRATSQLLIVLRHVDGDEKPAMPEVAYLMNHAKTKIKSNFSQLSKQPLFKKIMKIIDKRWECQMNHPLYGAALFLNPGKFSKLVKNNEDAMIGELRSCFNDVLSTMVTDPELRSKIDQQAMLYEDRRECFSNVMAIQNMESRSPIDWWKAYGGRAIELQRFAKRIVSLCASSSGCERNWSTFEFIHTKKRNRLQHKRLNDLVFVSYNRKMTARFKKRREKIADASFDPLVIEDFSWDNKWVDPTATLPEGARGTPDDLSWDDVDVAVGASQSLQGRHLPRRVQHHYSRQRRRPSSATVEEDEEFEVEQGGPPDLGFEENENSDHIIDDDAVSTDAEQDDEPDSPAADGHNEDEEYMGVVDLSNDDY